MEGSRSVAAPLRQRSSSWFIQHDRTNENGWAGLQVALVREVQITLRLDLAWSGCSEVFVHRTSITRTERSIDFEQ